MSGASFGTVNATGLNVTGILQASEIRTTQPIQVSNLTATGLTSLANVAVSGPSTLSSLSVSGATSVSNLNLGGNLQVTVKGVTANTTNAAFADLMATTAAGRTVLAKALNYGQNANVFITNGYIPLLSNGYSGKGVLFGHAERGLQFRVPGLRHISNPERIFTTNMNTFSNYHMSSYGVTYGGLNATTDPFVAPHTYTTCLLATGFDLHARLTERNFGFVNDADYPTWSSQVYASDAFVMGAAYNADVVNLEVMPGYNSTGSDPQLVTQFPSIRDYLDDIWVEVMEKAFYRGVQVASCTLGMNPTAINSTYVYYPQNAYFTGVGNPIAYISSLAADHNMVYCTSASNDVYTLGGVAAFVPEDNGGSGIMYPTNEARNILSVATKMIGPTSFYDSFLGPTNLTVSDQDYTERRIWSNIAPGANPNVYSTSNIFSQGLRVNKSYSTHGRTADKSGPGETNRVKPDIIGAQGNIRNVIAWPNFVQADNTNNMLYAMIISPATSGTSPSVAGGVCLLREALPLLDAHQIRECIMLSASNGNLANSNTYNGLGYGLINLEAALTYGQARTHFLPPKLTAGNWEYSAGFQANVLAGASNTLSPFQPFTQFGVASNTFSPKSVQSFKAPRDDEIYTSNTAYTTAYNNYTTAYNTYVGRAPSLWTAGVLDLSPARGLWGSSATRSFEAPTFDVVSTRSWISTSPEDLQEIKDLMVANGIKVCVTSNLLGAFSVDAESIEQLSAVVNGNTKIHAVFPVMTLQIHDNFDCE